MVCTWVKRLSFITPNQKNRRKIVINRLITRKYKACIYDMACTWVKRLSFITPQSEIFVGIIDNYRRHIVGIFRIYWFYADHICSPYGRDMSARGDHRPSTADRGRATIPWSAYRSKATMYRKLKFIKCKFPQYINKYFFRFKILKYMANWL